MTYYIIAYLLGAISGMIVWALLFKTIKTNTYIETDDIVVKKNSIDSPDGWGKRLILKLKTFKTEKL